MQLSAKTWPLMDAAFAFARDEYPALEPRTYIDRVARWGRQIRERLPAQSAELDHTTIAELNYFLFEEQGFRGNREDYYDPRNSYLNEVLDRKLGVPISLSVVYMEVAKFAGIPIHAVGFPGHFVVKCVIRNQEWFLDPFDGGAVLDESKLNLLLRQVYGDEAPDVQKVLQYLAPMDTKDIVIRMLRNLKGIYLGRQDNERSLRVLNRILTLAPRSLPELSERASVFAKMECFRAALKDLETLENLGGKITSNDLAALQRRLQFDKPSYH